jgi:hypothetical protein
MDKRTIYIIAAVVIVLAILGYALGWFGGSAPPPAAPLPAPATPPAATTPAPAPATPAPATPAPAAPAQ